MAAAIIIKWIDLLGCQQIRILWYTGSIFLPMERLVVPFSEQISVKIGFLTLRAAVVLSEGDLYSGNYVSKKSCSIR